ncbi:DUF3168 domain-containing protein [Sporomusa sp. KB1]|jgi:hypothetical protein|uniref:DUF3168 domain-containing protein n=1 Tax=Sporomusa sp. KB1 TaxID=943346 RepID=UPI0011A1A3FF|nr:DUF3168 domain-containing protein [Sporomusa sp. KB1]TWH49595.1 uncharacterized protein DUF3168 [Sporomusa sp. KB1]
MRRRVPINPLQTAIYNLLKEKQTTPVYDKLPKKQSFPYILISDYEYTLSGAKDTDICDITFELEIWTDYQGKTEVNEIVEDITYVLTAGKIDLSASGYKLIEKDAKSGKGARQDALFYGIVNFNAKTQNMGGQHEKV